MTASPQNLTAHRFEEHAQEVYAWAYRLLGRHHDALDVVQDVFLKWTRQCEREVPSVPRGWLRRVTVNRSVDVIRSWRGERQSDQLKATPAAPAKLDESVDYEVLRADVAAALDKLSDIQRAVLIAKVYDELTFSQIADEQDVALSTVKTHYLRAIRGVRDRLRRWDDQRSND